MGWCDVFHIDLFAFVSLFQDWVMPHMDGNVVLLCVVFDFFWGGAWFGVVGFRVGIEGW